MFAPFLSFPINQKQDTHFQQVGGLVTRNTSVFCFLFILLFALYFKDMLNSIDFKKSSFLLVTLARIIVSWSTLIFSFTLFS